MRAPWKSPMNRDDDLVASFSRAMPAHIAQATEWWLGFEGGDAHNLSLLRGLLQTIKAEAHMLDLRSCGELAELAEALVSALGRTEAPPPLVGDAILGAFEAMALVTARNSGQEPPDLEAVRAVLRDALSKLQAAAATTPERGSVQPAAERAMHATAPPAGPAAPMLRPEDVRELVHEMRRLYGEQEVLHARLREAQRMLRALLGEIDPQKPAQRIAEQVTKTLGYGAEVDRQISSIRREWSGNDFSLGLVLDELEGAIRRASVISTDMLLNQVRRV